MEVDMQAEDSAPAAAAPDRLPEKKSSSKKPKAKSKPWGATEHRFTIRKPEWHYLRLQMTFTPPHPTNSLSFPPDILTWKTHLSTALNQFLGISGTAIPVDFLHLSDDEVCIRIPREDATRFMAAVTGWALEVESRMVGFRVLGSSDFLMGLAGGDGRALFE